MDRANQPRRPKFGYILSSDQQHHPDVANYQNVISPTPTDPGHLNTPYSSNGPSPSHSPISAKDYPIMPRKIQPQNACFKIDSYHRKPNDNYLKTLPKTERQKSRRQRIAKLDDAIYELEQMYKKLKLSDQDLLDRAERRDLPTKFQLMRFSSASQIPPVSPTQVAKSDEELIQQQKSNRVNSTNELNKRRPISAFYNQFQHRTPPMRRSGVPDLIGDDQAVRRLNSPLPPKTPTITPSYLQSTPAYANPLNMQHQKKKNIYGHLEFDPIVDDLQYRKLSQSQSNVQPPHPPMGIPLSATLIKTNPINDYLHSTKTNDMAVRSLRKDYSVNQSNPFAHVLNRSSSQSFFQQHHHDENELLPETTRNYLTQISQVKKQLKPTRSMTMMESIDHQERDPRSAFEHQRVHAQYLTGQPERNRNPFAKSSSLSNCVLSQHVADEEKASLSNKPKNNIYKKQHSVSSLRDDAEEQLEDMLSNLNAIPKKSPDLVSMNKFGIINRSNRTSEVDLINNQHTTQSLSRLPQTRSQCNLPMQSERLQSGMSKSTSNTFEQQQPPPPASKQQERTFGLIRSPTEMLTETPKAHKALLKSRTQGNLPSEPAMIRPPQRHATNQRGAKLDQSTDRQIERPTNESKRKSLDNQIAQPAGEPIASPRGVKSANRSKGQQSTNERKIIGDQTRSSGASIWPKQIKKQIKTETNSDQWPANQSSQTYQNNHPTTDQATKQSNKQTNQAINQINQPHTAPVNNVSSEKAGKIKQYFFTKSSSLDQPSPNDERLPNVPYYFMPKRSNTQVDKMKSLFESKFNEELYNVPSRNCPSRPATFATKKSSTQPNLTNYQLNEPIDKKKKKPSKTHRLKPSKSAHALLSRSHHHFSKSTANRSSDESEYLQQFTDESEHETSSSSYDS